MGCGIKRAYFWDTLYIDVPEGMSYGAPTLLRLIRMIIMLITFLLGRGSSIVIILDNTPYRDIILGGGSL